MEEFVLVKLQAVSSMGVSYKWFQIAQSISIQLLSKGASKTTTKSKMELSVKNDNGESFTFATESPTLDSTKS